MFQVYESADRLHPKANWGKKLSREGITPTNKDELFRDDINDTIESQDSNDFEKRLSIFLNWDAEGFIVA